MDSPFNAQWDSLEIAARKRDDHVRANESPDFNVSALPGDDPHWLPGDPGPFGVPPALGVLVAAVRATSLKRLYPFMSLCRFCLGEGPAIWTGRDRVAPAFVAYDCSGYTIFSGAPYDFDGNGPDQDWGGAWGTVTLRTRDETAAAAELERLLAGWPNRT